MTLQNALDIASRCSELVALCARFQATYGRYVSVKLGSPAAVMYHDIMAKQTEIAALLSPEIVRAPGDPVNQWWKRQDVIDLSIASDIHKESARLIACCAYLDADPAVNQWSYSVQASQAAIASLLHPMARSTALEQLQTAS